MAGAAITIGLQQLKGLLNITDFTNSTDFVSVMKSVFSQTHEVCIYIMNPGTKYLNITPNEILSRMIEVLKDNHLVSDGNCNIVNL